MMNLTQTQIVGTTMELDLKVREYKMLCEKLEDLKSQNIDPNDEKFVELLNEFQKNHDKIVTIKKILSILNNMDVKGNTI